MRFEVSAAFNKDGEGFLSVDMDFSNEPTAYVYHGGPFSMSGNDVYQEELKSGKIIKNTMSFRTYCEFCIARKNGKFSQIGIT